MLVSSTLAFTQERLELNIGGEFYRSSNIAIGDVSSTTYSMVFGLTGMHYFSDLLGLFINANFNLPFVSTVNYKGDSYDIKQSDYKFWLGIDGLIGPVFNVLRKENFNIPIAFGIHILRMATVEVGGGTSNSSYGLGLNIGLEKNINEILYFLVRLQSYVDFINKNNKENVYEFFHNKTHFDILGWGIEPMIGIGIKI
jgi:hypothetical protein